MGCLLPLFFWDPSPVAFTIPFVDHPVLWYSIFFAIGFLGAYFIVAHFLFGYLKNDRRRDIRHFTEKLSYYLFIGMLLGSRLGHVLFYEWSHYKAHPAEIIAIWKGGLSSHGGAIGILMALLLFWHSYKSRFPSLSLKKLLDFLCIGAAFAAGCIRIGNFFNQEITGIYTTAWTAVWFGNPAEPGAKMPCHPVQLYESFFYFFSCATCWLVEKRKFRVHDGALAGLFFIALFSFRFFIEWFKLPQAASDGSGLHMGQLLSLPFILLGIYLIFCNKTNDKNR